MFSLDDCIGFNFNYEIFHSFLANHSKSKFDEKKRKEKVDNEDLLSVVIGGLILEVDNPKNRSLKHKDIDWKFMYMRIIMDSGAIMSIIYESYKSKNYFIT